jgi:predicted secreted protein
MAWNPSPEVAVARDAAVKLKADRVVIVYTTAAGNIGYASYGETKALCAEAKVIADKVYKTAYRHFENT